MQVHQLVGPLQHQDLILWVLVEHLEMVVAQVLHLVPGQVVAGLQMELMVRIPEREEDLGVMD
jgi:hypothetical protein